MKLIDKDALVEYIGQRYIEHQIGNQPIGCLDRMDEDKEMLLYLNTLEVKEVDLEKEYKEFVEDDLVYGRLVNNIVGKAIAKHFFELGLNAQQNISIDITNIDKIIEENGVDPNSKEAKIFKESYYMALERLKAKKGE